MKWVCPVCGGSCRIRSSKQPIAELRIAYLQCNDIQCGWRGKGTFEIVESFPAPRIA